MDYPERRVVIIGGGFGGVRSALDLESYNLPNTKIILISDKPHFEYHAALYRVVTGKSPLEVCVPLDEIFKEKSVEVICDTVEKVDLSNKTLLGSSQSIYRFDYLVLALGSETVYFDIPGLKEYSFGFKSIQEALRLKRHLHEVFASCELSQKEDKVCSAQIVVVGGGASGVELAGELAIYTKDLAKKHNMEPSLVTIDLIEAAPRILPTMPPDVSEKARVRLQSLGVNIFLNRALMKEEFDEIYLKDIELKAKTVIWTAGVKPHHLYTQVAGLSFDKRGKVIVDATLRPSGFENVFVVGDASSTEFSGMAQTAVLDGKSVAKNVKRLLSNQTPTPASSKKPSYAIPVGPGFAVVLLGSLRVYGFVGWVIRRLIDLKFFMSILPFNKALLAFQSGKTVCESCLICSVEV